MILLRDYPIKKTLQKHTYKMQIVPTYSIIFLIVKYQCHCNWNYRSSNEYIADYKNYPSLGEESNSAVSTGSLSIDWLTKLSVSTLKFDKIMAVGLWITLSHWVLIKTFDNEFNFELAYDLWTSTSCKPQHISISALRNSRVKFRLISPFL